VDRTITEGLPIDIDRYRESDGGRMIDACAEASLTNLLKGSDPASPICQPARRTKSRMLSNDCACVMSQTRLCPKPLDFRELFLGQLRHIPADTGVNLF